MVDFYFWESVKANISGLKRYILSISSSFLFINHSILVYNTRDDCVHFISLLCLLVLYFPSH